MTLDAWITQQSQSQSRTDDNTKGDCAVKVKVKVKAHLRRFAIVSSSTQCHSDGC